MNVNDYEGKQDVLNRILDKISQVRIVWFNKVQMADIT